MQLFNHVPLSKQYRLKTVRTVTMHEDNEKLKQKKKKTAAYFLKYSWWNFPAYFFAKVNIFYQIHGHFNCVNFGKVFTNFRDHDYIFKSKIYFDLMYYTDVWLRFE
jgi:hypothetical protein